MSDDLRPLTADRSMVDALYRDAQAGKPEAVEFFASLWAGVETSTCFICDQKFAEQPSALILPDPTKPTANLLAPLCVSCRALPTMWKYGKALKILKRMHKATGRKGFGWHFHAGARPPHPR